MRGKVLGLVGLILVSLMLMLLVASNVPLRMLADALSSTPPYQVFLSLVAGEGGGQSHDCDYCCGYYSPDNPYSCWCGGTEGNCVWWGYFKRPETAHWIGKQICPSGWDNYAEAEGLPVGSIPLEKALVIWDWTSLNGSCGHVAYVEDVYPSFPNEYSKFHLSEMNCGVAGCKKERDCFADGGNNIHFIYECGEVPQTFGPGGGVEIENRSPARLSWVDCFEHYDVQLDVAPWHNNACWPREWWGTTFNVTGSSMDLYDFEDPEHLAFLPDGEYWWRIRGYRGDNPSDWSDWQHFLLVNCSPPFTFSPRLRTARVAGEILSQSYFCPSNPPGTSTPVPTETPCPTAVPTATTIPFTKPQLVSPADGAEFNSGDQIVLTWSCPGGRAWSKVVVEREGVTHDSGWTKEFS
ncbi:CHAP domain-containing protein, partial [Candidatus Parcubacteria bacterium]|nr:CHAP domain-containing protein [Candidatus Parcubacteria bacterium]